jgi:hypothetical protein
MKDCGQRRCDIVASVSRQSDRCGCARDDGMRRNR